MTTRQPSQAVGVVGVGYQGRALEQFVDDLVADQVSRLVDVRLTPVSRKRGFSKTALRRALEAAGVIYEHRPELGNPRPNRAGFAGSAEELRGARDAFAALLRTPLAMETIESLAQVSTVERVALLCFEADQQRCHRDVVLEEIASRNLTASGSRHLVH